MGCRRREEIAEVKEGFVGCGGGRVRRMLGRDSTTVDNVSGGFDMVRPEGILDVEFLSCSDNS